MKLICVFVHHEIDLSKHGRWTVWVMVLLLRAGFRLLCCGCLHVAASYMTLSATGVSQLRQFHPSVLPVRYPRRMQREATEHSKQAAQQNAAMRSAEHKQVSAACLGHPAAAGHPLPPDLCTR